MAIYTMIASTKSISAPAEDSEKAKMVLMSGRIARPAVKMFVLFAITFLLHFIQISTQIMTVLYLKEYLQQS